MRFLTLSLFAALLSAPAFAADLGTYRPGTPYNSTVAGGADVCESQCAGDAQCRGWNYVKPNPRAAGICEFLSSVSAPIASQVSISGESQSAGTFSPRVTQGNTNTVRVGTQSAAPRGPVRVGHTATNRRIIRQAPPNRIVPGQTSTRTAVSNPARGVENLSLTEQQNRYRQAQGVGEAQFAPQQPPHIQGRQTISAQQDAAVQRQRPNFRPLLDGAAPQNLGSGTGTPQFREPQRVPPAQSQASRRVTGPRNQGRGQVRGQAQQQGRAYGAPQFQDPRKPYSGQSYPGQNYPGQSYQGQSYPPQPGAAPQGQPQQHAALTGSSRPPVGQPIPAPQQPVRPRPSTPSQRLAAFTAQARAAKANIAQSTPVPATASPAAQPAQPTPPSLFGRLNDDVIGPQIPTASAVPTQPVSEQPLDDILAGGL